MDIFTTQLAKVAPNKLEVDKLRVKAVAKEARLHRIKDDVKELDPDAAKQNHSQQQLPKKEEKIKEENPDDESQSDDSNHLDIYV